MINSCRSPTIWQKGKGCWANPPGGQKLRLQGVINCSTGFNPLTPPVNSHPEMNIRSSTCAVFGHPAIVLLCAIFPARKSDLVWPGLRPCGSTCTTRDNCTEIRCVPAEFRSGRHNTKRPPPAVAPCGFVDSKIQKIGAVFSLVVLDTARNRNSVFLALVLALLVLILVWSC